MNLMLKTKVVDCLKKVIKKPEFIEVFVPENEKFGHYSTNAALRLAKLQGKNPMEIAENIKSHISNLKSDFFEKIEVAPPGFINFWLSPKAFQDELKEILKKKEKYGKSQIANRKSQKIQVEFISANPTGPLTIGNGRGGFLGDVLGNILKAAGAEVKKEYYVNDSGAQIMALGKSMLAAVGDDRYINEENLYRGEYIKEWAEKNINKKGDVLAGPIGKKVAKFFLEKIKESLKKAGIEFDVFTSETEQVLKKDYDKKVLKIFKEKKVIYEKDGATWLKTIMYGDDKDRVLIRGVVVAVDEKRGTYFLADAGHYLKTKEEGFTKKINILGPDHYGYVARIQAVAKILGLDSKVIITQAVRLIQKGVEVKMSKRTGEYLTLEDLIKEVGLDATRFFFLMNSPDTHMDFDLDLAKERSLKNPVYYVQYAAVRIQGILTKLKTKNLKLKTKIDFNLLNTTEDINLMRMLVRFPEAVEEAAKNYNPQILVRYSLDLARQFHNFYEKERIIGEEKELMSVRLELIKAARIIFKNLFELLGISLPKRM